ncbi:hypothetical protein DPMN_102512 [Dreissena polymorpha]|uniref:Uncharacterized protein n=1 Tax=Dreissena polymorpha TaxID=45954 RepID=A0A9D4LLI0_DREPO|nr:hypothetical protein DPMN_102512 [Dreissena polymorpha]
MDFPGPYCEQVGLTCQALNDSTIQPITPERLTNGLVLELRWYANNVNRPLNILFEWLRLLQPTKSNDSTLKYRIKNANEISKKLNEKNKVKGFSNLAEFKSSAFNVVESSVKHSPHMKIVNEQLTRELIVPDNSSKEVDRKNPVNEPIDNDVVTDSVLVEKSNLTDYEIQKKQKTLKKLQKLLTSKRENLDILTHRKGHYSV